MVFVGDGTDTPAEVERVLLYGESTQLCGILTLPAERRNDRPTVVLLNAGILHKAGPNRIHVRLARRIAAHGMLVFRFDMAGVGDSRARTDGRALSSGVVADVRETLDHLQRHYDAQQFVLLGLCSGADNALRAAQHDSRVTGLALLDPTVQRTRRWYWEHYASRALSPDVWRRIVTLQHPGVRRLAERVRAKLADRPQIEQVSSSRPAQFRTGLGSREVIAQHLKDVLKRNVQLFYAITGGWESLYNYREQLLDLFPEVDFGSSLRLHHYANAEHTFDMEAHRQELFADLLDWLQTTAFVKPAAHPALAPSPAESALSAAAPAA